MAVLNITKNQITEQDWHDAKRELGLTLNTFTSKDSSLFLNNFDATLSNTVRTLEWLINRGYITIINQ